MVQTFRLHTVHVETTLCDSKSANNIGGVLTLLRLEKLVKFSPYGAAARLCLTRPNKRFLAQSWLGGKVRRFDK